MAESETQSLSDNFFERVGEKVDVRVCGMVHFEKMSVSVCSFSGLKDRFHMFHQFVIFVKV